MFTKWTADVRKHGRFSLTSLNLLTQLFCACVCYVPAYIYTYVNMYMVM